MRRLKETIRLNQTNRCPGCHESFQKVGASEGRDTSATRTMMITLTLALTLTRSFTPARSRSRSPTRSPTHHVTTTLQPPTKLMDETDYSHYNVPKLLPCLHTVSQKFLRQYVTHSNPTVTHSNP